MWVWLGTHKGAKKKFLILCSQCAKIEMRYNANFCLSIRGYLRKLIWVAVATYLCSFCGTGSLHFSSRGLPKKQVKTRKRWHVGSQIYRFFIFFIYILGVKIPFAQNRYIVFQIKLKYPLLVDIYRNSKLIPSFQAVYQPSS